MAITVTEESLNVTVDDREVKLYHIKNNKGLEVCVMNYGVILRNLFVPDKEGKAKDVVLGWQEFEQYKTNRGFLGATIGPNCNRIKNGRYRIDGAQYTLPVNDGENNCHSDKEHGFDKRVWNAEMMPDGVRFTLDAPDGDIGFPGNRHFTVDVTIANLSCAVMLTYHATSDANTLINMTNHSYFNLGGCTAGSILDHVVQLNASFFTPVHPGSIPTGETKKVEKTPFDFLEPKTIGRDIDKEDKQLKIGGGYDHNFMIDRADGSLERFALVTCKETGIAMEALTTLPAFQFYTGNHLQGFPGKEGAAYVARQGLCLESQYVPNAINDKNFTSPVFGPEAPYHAQTCFRFTVVQE